MWQAVWEGRDLLGPAPPHRWSVPRDRVLAPATACDGDHAWSDRGGYVTGFDELFDPQGYGLPADRIRALDPLFRWVLHTARAALADAGVGAVPARCGAVLGNLSFPTASLNRLAQAIWRGEPPGDPTNRFMSGLPALLLRQALGLDDRCLALDAACASGLYAIDVACKRLADGHADWMLAGAVNAADDLFIHVGFCALQAMSRTGRSRPFHRGADGLVPAEGCAFLLLRRLDDALRDGDTVHGVIRGVGTSNDGRGRGLLAPSTEGQVRALRQAWVRAGLDPATVGYVECHATGTPVGDAVEVATLTEVFPGGVPIGSLKSNLGHLVTVAGVAGVLKVLGAMRHASLPPTLHADDPADAVRHSPLRPVLAPTPWESAHGVLRAAVSAFGFGGNNAHVVIDAPGPHLAQLVSPPVPEVGGPVAVVAVAARSGTRGTLELLDPPGRHRRRMDRVELRTEGLRFPPRDLEVALAQQLLALQTARDAVWHVPDLPRERTAVLVGMGTDAEVCRYGARWEALHAGADGDAFTPTLVAAGVVGTMPNIPANRVCSQLDLAGPSYTVAAEDASGLAALELATRDLAAGELDAALVGAVDLCCEPVHEIAAAALLPGAPPPADAAVCLVLLRLADAEARNLPVLAVLQEQPGPGLPVPAHDADLGHAHAAAGLVALTRAVLAFSRGVWLDGSPLPADALAHLGYTDMGGHVWRASLHRRTTAPRPQWGAGPSGPTRSYPAHPPPVVLSTRRQAAAPEAHVSLPPAPWLPPTTARADGRPSTVPAPALDPAKASPAPPASATADDNPLAQTLAEQVRLAAEAHTRFLSHQTATHERFLALRRATTQTLTALGSTTAPAVDEGPAWSTPSIAPPPPPEVGSLALAPPPTPLRSPEGVRPEPAAPPRPAAPPKLPAPTAGNAPPPPVGPTLDRGGLTVHASGAISAIFGPLFAPQDGYHRQTRMPEPPLLLADRMTGLQAAPGSMGKGTVWTETDVTERSWYLHKGRMPAGIHIESGQADLLLISYLGVDLLNRGERIYRLLGCELTWHGPLPAVGETLCYDIHVDGHASQGPIRLFFFHYDCRIDGQVRLSVRHGQAGFFTDQELADSAGVLWRAEEQEVTDAPRLDPPACSLGRGAFDREALEAFAEGEPWRTFGPAWDPARQHVRTPTIQGGRMLFLDRVDTLEVAGGPWGRGYLRATQDIRPDLWFFDGHFKNDPCMPGTLMFEGCVQALSFYLAALGHTIRRDGWRFQPVPGQPCKMICRGQVTPSSRELTYEVFVEEVYVRDGVPTIHADLLCTVDGLKAFHARRFCLELVPDHPLADRHEVLRQAEAHDARHAARLAVGRWEGSDHTFGLRSLLACAWGRPSQAFGPMYARFDGTRHVARLPGPPYHFMTRVVGLEGSMGGCEAGSRVVVEWDIPADAWFYDDDASERWADAVLRGALAGATPPRSAPAHLRPVPFAVLLEAALQPCGWLSSYAGCALVTDDDLYFRNLDGAGTLHRDIFPGDGPLTTTSTLTRLSRVGGMTIVGFEVRCSVPGTSGQPEPVYTLDTVFGFFPKVALENQVGLPGAEAWHARREVLEAPAERDEPFDGHPCTAGSCRVPPGMLRMVDRVTGWWPDAGASGLGGLRVEKTVSPGDWSFKAHFHGDPVQPGSLGIEMMLQALMWSSWHLGLHSGLARPMFQAVATGTRHAWKYRGQVVSTNQKVQVTLELTALDRADRTVVGDASLWVDGKRIYEATSLGMRVVEAPVQDGSTRLDPQVDGWVLDHRPTFTVPALPLMDIVDRLAAAAGATALEDVRVKRWVTVDRPRSLSVTLAGDRVGLSVDGEPVAEARVARPGGPPAPLAPLGTPAERDPYGDATLFHGPAFRRLTHLLQGDAGSTSLLSAEPTARTAAVTPPGVWNPALLDAATHGIPHDALNRWFPSLGPDLVAYPVWIPRIEVFGPTPRSGTVRCEVRADGLRGTSPPMPAFQVQLLVDEEPGPRVWCAFRLVEAGFPKGSLGMAPADQRRDFLRDRRPAPLRLSTVEDDVTRLTEATVAASDWLPGTVEATYGSRSVEDVALREHVAAELGVHPSVVPAGLPLNPPQVTVSRVGDEVRVRSLAGSGDLDLEPVRAWWDAWFKLGRWPVEDVYYGLMQRFVRRVILTDPEPFHRWRGRSVVYLGNHQTGVESLLFSILASALGGLPTVTVAKVEHKGTWLGGLIRHCFSWPGCQDPRVLTYFDRQDRESLPRLAQDLAAEMVHPGRSVMVHVEGTRSVTCRLPVQKMSGTFVDMALAVGSAVVPVRFTGGLPAEPLEHRVEFPMGLGTQDVWIGAPLEPDDLAGLPYGARKQRVVDAINGLGPRNSAEEPHPGDPALVARVEERVVRTGASPEHATLLETLRLLPAPSVPIRRLLSGDVSGELVLDGGAEDAWLGELALRLYGQRGARVRG